MDLLHTAQSVQLKLAKHLTPHPIVFHHVPKCGGSSLARSLAIHYYFSHSKVHSTPSTAVVSDLFPNNSFETYLQQLYNFREQLLLYLLQCGQRCISGHIPFNKTIYDLFKTQYYFVTILRDPKERFISHWFHNQRQWPDLAKQTSLDIFLESEYARRWGALYVEYFSGQKGKQVFNTEAIEDAKTNLSSLSAIGFLDDLNTFESHLRTLLGTRLHIRHINKAPNANATDWSSQLTRQQLNSIKSICAPDLELLHYAKAITPKKA